MPLELLPLQKVGADYLASKFRAGLFDDMGVGKTAQAIGALDRVGAIRIIIVCPAAVRETWRGEFRKFATVHRRILKAADVNDLSLFLRGKADVMICSYDMATKWAPRLSGDLYDAIVFDEAHYLKTPTAARTRAFLGTLCDGKTGLARWGAHVWFLTGTPIPNSPIDIWSWMRFVGATSLVLERFTARYFRTRQKTYSADYSVRQEVVGELRQAIGQFSIRRTKAEMGLNLPPIWLTTQIVDGDTAEIKDLMRQYPGMEKAVIEAIEKGGLSFLDAQHIATLRRLVGEAKAPAFINLIAEELANGLDKVVIMGIHTRALATVRDGLTRRGVRCVHVDGQVREDHRIEAVNSFQSDPEVRVFIGNIRAAGTGLTLTAASDIVMFESDWAPASNVQAIMRIHRVGQTKECRARFITLANSIDEIVEEVVARKTAAIAKIGFEGMQ